MNLLYDKNRDLPALVFALLVAGVMTLVSSAVNNFDINQVITACIFSFFGFRAGWLSK